MAFRFQKRIKIAPGLRLNISHKSVGLTGGVPGASVSAGKKGVHSNVGIPGTGLSHRHRLDGGKTRTREPADQAQYRPNRAAAILILIGVCSVLVWLAA